jgi:hypothetical protein
VSCWCPQKQGYSRLCRAGLSLPASHPPACPRKRLVEMDRQFRERIEPAFLRGTESRDSAVGLDAITDR